MLENQVKVDTSSLKLLKDSLKVFSEAKDYKSTLKGLKDVVLELNEELKLPKSFIQRANNVLTLACKSSEYKLHPLDHKTRQVKLYFYNIEKAINLLDFIRVDRGDEEVTKVKNKLNRASKLSDKTAYNDEYAKVLKELYKEYKVVMTDTGDVIKVAMNEEGMKDFINKAFEANKLDLLEALVKQAKEKAKEETKAS